MADAKACGFDALAAEELVSSIFQHQRVSDAYAKICERDINEHGAPSEVHSGRVRRFTVDDLMRVWELSNKAGSRISPLGQQLLAAMDAGYQVGDVLNDTTVKTLRGLERHLQRLAARIAKAASVGYSNHMSRIKKSHKTNPDLALKLAGQPPLSLEKIDT